MTKSELIEAIARNQKHLPAKDVELAVKHILELMSEALASGERIEIRGFGSFSLHFRPPRMGRNPKTGDAVALAGKHVPHFKPGKDLRERVNASRGVPVRARPRRRGPLPHHRPVWRPQPVQPPRRALPHRERQRAEWGARAPLVNARGAETDAC